SVSPPPAVAAAAAVAVVVICTSSLAMMSDSAPLMTRSAASVFVSVLMMTIRALSGSASAAGDIVVLVLRVICAMMDSLSLFLSSGSGKWQCWLNEIVDEHVRLQQYHHQHDLHR